VSGHISGMTVNAHSFEFEYTFNSAKHIPFDWTGP
jgi:hypothetical protein